MDSILNWPMMNEVVSDVEQVVHLAAAVGVKKIMDERTYRETAPAA